jgi:hypothetical protein
MENSVVNESCITYEVSISAYRGTHRQRDLRVASIFIFLFMTSFLS